MKKALVLILSLALMIPTAACSHSSNKTDSTGSGAASEDDYDDPAAKGTKYTKGYIKDNVFINKYADIRMNIPEGLNATLGNVLAQNKEMFVASFSEGSDQTREKARIWDVQFADSQQNIAVNFINTKLAFPDTKNVTEDDVLDSYKDYIDQAVITAGSQVRWTERKKVNIGGEEYLGTVAYYGGSDSNYEALYMRKLDNKLICWIQFATNSPDRPPEYYEKLFE